MLYPGSVKALLHSTTCRMCLHTSEKSNRQQVNLNSFTNFCDPATPVWAFLQLCWCVIQDVLKWRDTDLRHYSLLHWSSTLLLYSTITLESSMATNLFTCSLLRDTVYFGYRPTAPGKCRKITGYTQSSTALEGTLESANELNQFFNRFDLPTPMSSAGQTGSPLITSTSAPTHTSPPAFPRQSL